MSLETWKAEFYPLEASETEPEEALGHSLRKWEGLRRENLARHRCHISKDGAVEDSRDHDLGIHAGSCALCYHHWNCDGCPLALTLGDTCDRYPGPWFDWRDRWDPEPMITALKGCVEQRKVA